jgi:hypothetical protein
MAATVVTIKNGQITITPGTEAVNTTTYYPAGVKVLDIEWSVPTGTTHTVTIGTDSSNTDNVWSDQCTTANLSKHKPFSPPKWFANLYVPVQGAAVLASGKVIITLASK